MKRLVKYILIFLPFAVYSCVKDGEDLEKIGFSLEELNLSSGSVMTAVDVHSSKGWTLTAPEWIVCSPEEGIGDMTVSMTVSSNPGYGRTAKINLFSSGESASLAVFQEGTKGSSRPNNKAPDAPVLVFPRNGDGNIPINPIFLWRAPADPDGDELTYELQVSFDGGNTWPYVTPVDGTEGVSDWLLDKRKVIMWRVKAMDGFGGESVSDVRMFRTGDTGGLLDGETCVLQQESASAQNPVNIVFTGDGYISADWADDGKFMQDVQRAIDVIFEVEPYKSYREYFRVSVVAAHSQERGATVLNDMGHLGPGKQKKNTIFQSKLQGGGDTFVSGNNDMVIQYAKKVPGIETKSDINNTTVFILINVDAYAGTCTTYSGGFSACYCPLGTMIDGNSGQPAYKSIIIHEGAGHGFGCLMDEYRYYDEPVTDYWRQMLETFRNDNYLSGWNVSFTGNREDVIWKHYFGLPGYEAVDMYEGALLYCYGVWRPEIRSCMEDNRPYFNAPSREAIVRRIHDIAGIKFDFDEFVEKDIIKSDPTGRAAKAPGLNVPELYFPPLAPPVYIVED